MERSDSDDNEDDDDDDKPIAKLIKHKSGKDKEPDEAPAQQGFIGSSAAAAAAANAQLHQSSLSCGTLIKPLCINLYTRSLDVLWSNIYSYRSAVPKHAPLSGQDLRTLEPSQNVKDQQILLLKQTEEKHRLVFGGNSF